MSAILVLYGATKMASKSEEKPADDAATQEQIAEEEAAAEEEAPPATAEAPVGEEEPVEDADPGEISAVDNAGETPPSEESEEAPRAVVRSFFKNMFNKPAKKPTQEEKKEQEEEEKPSAVAITTPTEEAEKDKEKILPTETNNGEVSLQPSISSVSPGLGPAEGGTLITISGIDFQDGATVTVGGISCTPVTWVNSVTLTCLTGPRIAALVSIVVTNPGGLSDTKLSAYSYYGNPRTNVIVSVGTITPGPYGRRSSTGISSNHQTFVNQISPTW